MKQSLFDALSCPLDGLALAQRGASMFCADGHCFDFDRRGALNLLPVQFKKSLDPGDSRDMVLARREFLEAGFYQPIADTLHRLVASYIALRAPKTLAILDAGCGEGYYTAGLAAHLRMLESAGEFSCAGLDISKHAIHEAAKRGRDISWLVGSNKKLPVADRSLDIILCLFGFPVWPEFARTLKPRGLVLCADPGADHLVELRRVLYPELKMKDEDAVPVIPGWEMLQTEELRCQTPAIPPAQITHLLTMTPHGYRATAERKAQAVQTPFPAMTLDVAFRLWQNFV